MVLPFWPPNLPTIYHALEISSSEITSVLQSASAFVLFLLPLTTSLPLSLYDPSTTNMPFAQGDIFSATFDEEVFQRPGASSSRSSSLLPSIHSSQIFTISLLLFVGTALQAYFAPASSMRLAIGGADTFQSFSKDAVMIISDTLSPLMLLAVGVGMAGTLCRGLEVVIESAAFKGRAL